MAATTGFTYKHPHPAVTVDVATFTYHEGEIKVLLVRRAVEPFKGQWALPGGFLKPTEGLEEAARREIEEETGLTGLRIQQVGAFGDPGRDPRERVVSIAHMAVVRHEDVAPRAGSDAAEVAWMPLFSPPRLAFDHKQILAFAHQQLVHQIRETNLSVDFLQEEFTLTELQKVHEAVMGAEMDKRNFRKWVATMEFLKPTRKHTTGGAHRPALLYRADRSLR